jgi:predicted neuraminidase
MAPLTLVILTVAALFAQDLCLAHAAVSQEFIYTDAPFPSAHASTIVELKNGDFLSAWFGGSAEGKPDVAIWSARRAGGGWTAPAELAREPNIACYNPVLFYSADGKLWLYYNSDRTLEAGRPVAARALMTARPGLPLNIFQPASMAPSAPNRSF